MRKILKTISIIIAIFLICLVLKLDILDFSAFNIGKETNFIYTGYYYNQLEPEEKEIYSKIDYAVKNMKKTVPLGNVQTEELTENIGKVLTAYFYDNPKVYYLSNQYMVSTSNLMFFKTSTLELNYTTSSNEEIMLKNIQLEQALKEFIKTTVTDNMTEFEKEVAIHDELVKRINYYDYESIDNIPNIKHTAYGALVQNEAVCDGYSKAFKLLLEEVGIENIIISGTTEGMAHAWNIVSIGEEYYHVDVTSDKIENKNKYIIHTYFNLNDNEITKTHNIDKTYNIPKCNYDKYDYYTQKGYYISINDNIYTRLRNITAMQEESKILELKVDKKYTDKRLIDTLYDIDFNGWRSTGKSRVEYTKVQDKYIFIK